MDTYPYYLGHEGCDLDSDVTLGKLYHFIKPRVKRLARSYSTNVPVWGRQVEDLTEEYTQEAIFRTWQYAQRVGRNEVRPLRSVTGMCMRIAQNFCTDKSRKDGRLVPIEQDDRSPEQVMVKYAQVDSIEAVIEKIFEEELLLLLPPEIVKFSPKLRRALLIDLANLMDFFGQSTSLQQAFLDVGIRMQDYQLPLPVDPVERSRHASLVSLAYRRIRELPCVQQYISAP
jgi:DNA-directed RNA polymerase specialized sigma24 family protein